MSKVIILTGASRGMGLAMAHFLLKESAQNKLVVVARTAAPLEKLRSEYPGRVESVVGDLKDFSIGKKATDLALTSFSRLDALILNHGTLGDVKRVADSTAEEWREVFDVNFFSLVSFIKPALPSLRETKGRIVFVSSGAAVGAYSTWGAYGSSKAAMNHLALTLAVEEPDVTTVSIRPGVVDTEMQQDIRTKHSTSMDAKDAAKFKTLHEGGQLLRPEQPGNVMARLALAADKGLSGKFFSWNDNALSAYQDA